MTLRPAAPADLPALRALLRRCGLPLDGFDDQLPRTLVAEATGVVGCAAIELYPPYALLRSVAVDEAARGQGLGHRLTVKALALARRLGAAEVFLLTETAVPFFERLGFAPVARADVPAAVQQSAELRSACPASAQVMRRVL